MDLPKQLPPEMESNKQVKCMCQHEQVYCWKTNGTYMFS